MYRRLAHSTLILGLGILLSACGFQLRGVGENTTAVPDSWKSMYLQAGNPNLELNREVIAQFAANGVQWTDRDSANYILVLSPERFRQRNLSLNSEARVAEIELNLSAEFSVLDADNNVVIEKNRLAVVSQMQNNPRNVVGKNEEVRLLRNEMRSDLTRQIMRRIGFHAASTQPLPNSQ